MSNLDSPLPLPTLISICYPTLMSIENKLKIEKNYYVQFSFVRYSVYILLRDIILEQVSAQPEKKLAVVRATRAAYII